MGSAFGFSKTFKRSLRNIGKHKQKVRRQEMADLATQVALERQRAADVLALEREFAPQSLEERLSQQRRFLPEQAALRRNVIGRELGLIEDLAPRVRRLGMSPEDRAIMDKVGGQIEAELAAGGKLTPEEQRQLEQTTRAGFAGRGLPFGMTPKVSELVNRLVATRAARTTAQNKALSFLKTKAAREISPAQFVGGAGIPQVPQFQQQQLPMPTVTTAGILPTTMGINLQDQIIRANMRAARESQGGGTGALIGAGLGAVGGFMVGGPFGAMAGAKMGSSLGSAF